ncbi:GAF domain-containing protein [Phormidium tenue FACHB-886]|nr:GAF domain-containing protein [Phormidium tenue FACHB-886]
MTLASSPNGTLAALTQANRRGDLTNRVRDLPISQFIDLLDQITREFEQFLRAIDMINNETLETMLEQILEAFTLKIGQILQADRTTIYLVDEEKGQLWSKVAQDDGEKPLEIRLPLNVGIAGHVAATGKCLNIPDAYSHPLLNREVDQQTGYRTRNVLCMPVFSTKNRVVAVVQLLNKCGEQPFDQTDEQLFRDFAESMGIILESCNSFYIAARNQRGAAALLKATASLGQSLDLEKTLSAVMTEAQNLMQADRSTLFLLSDDGNELWSKVAKADGTTLMDLRIPVDRGIAGYVASTRQILNITNAYEDPRFDPTVDEQTGYCTRTILCMPVYNSAGALIGVTQLINKQQGTFTPSDEEFMCAFNIQAGIALENAQLFERVLLEKQYQKDILQSLSDAVISTDMQGRIVTINDAALALLNCPQSAGAPQAKGTEVIGQLVWEIVPIENLQMRLEDSLKHAAKSYVPEQSLVIGAGEAGIKGQHVIERSINLTVNPLTNPEGGVRGGLVVLEDISQEKRMKATMYRYMTPGVAERVMALRDDALMEGERKEVSILFSDIRSYTSLTEKMGATEVVSLLNNYFETMVEAVFNFEGTLDKFIGDALMAVFGAPLPLENHAWMAVQSALDMRQRLAEFNHRRQIASQPQIRVGIGLSSGEVVSGNIGSQKRMDYTVIGDGVDISSRLEGVTKEYGCDIVLSEYTYELCRDKIWVRELDRIRVKGKTRPIRIYELIGDCQTPLTDFMQEFLDLYHAGREAYSTRDFQRAIRHFQSAQRLRANDLAVATHIERATNYIFNPPPEDWDGVYTMTTK